MKMFKVLAVLAIAFALAAPASALTVTAVTSVSGGLLYVDLWATAGPGENNPNAFEVNAVNVRQEWAFGGALQTRSLDNASFLANPADDTHLLFPESAFVANNSVDGPHDVTSPFTSTFWGDQISLTPAAVPGSSFAFMHLVFDAVLGGSVSGLVASPGLAAPAQYSFTFPAGPIIPIPAALPLGLAGLGLLTVIRRKLS